MPCIKVGINEWVVINKAGQNDFTLWTNGLSGCVGVAIATSDRAFMTHIDSHTTIADWNGNVDGQVNVKNQFLAAVGNLVNFNDIEFCNIVLGDSDTTNLAEMVSNAIVEVLEQRNANIDESDVALSYPFTGMRIYLDAGTFKLEKLKQMGHQNAWGMNRNSQGAAGIAAQGFFPGGDRAEI